MFDSHTKQLFHKHMAPHEKGSFSHVHPDLKAKRHFFERCSAHILERKAT